MKATCVILLSALSLTNLFAQKFWLTTYEFQGGPKTDITIANDSCLFVGLLDGVIRSCDEGNNFDSVLVASSISSLFASQSGKVYAGGSGKIFRTGNLGQTWDSSSVNTTYPVIRLVENQQGDLFAITGIFTNIGYLGDGVFFSDDEGATWTQRNNGLGIYTCMEGIAIDKNGRLYVAAADENVTGNGGLFISDNDGLLWEHVNISIDGRGDIPDQIKVGNALGLTVSPDDSVYFSFLGTAVNLGVQLNTRKSIQDIRANNFWDTYSSGISSTWWMDRVLGNIHFARNGDKYSSSPGTINSGGTFFSKAQSGNWQRFDYGLGVDVFGQYNIQSFAEAPSGKIFMTQLLDERVYWADTSLLTSIHPEMVASPDFYVFPNPAACNEKLFVQSTTDKFYKNERISIRDVTGKEIGSTLITGTYGQATAPSTPGIYFISVDARKLRAVRLIVR